MSINNAVNMTRFILLLLCLTTTALKAQTFMPVNPAAMGFKNAYQSSVAWGDYNNDGGMDVFISGQDQIGPFFSKLYKNNKDGTFQESPNNFMALYDGSSAWGDYDNDGYLDLLITGTQSGVQGITKLYHNKGDGTFEENPSNFTGVFYSSTAWSDFDNDGDLDILITGYKGGEGISEIYENNGNGVFVNSGIPLPGVFASSVAWADYDNDGDQDILITGIAVNPSNMVGKIYRNNGNKTFSDANIPLVGVGTSSVAWSDYNQDGYQDIVLTGRTNANTKTSKVYRNKGDGTFEDSNIPLTAIGAGTACWADFDNDGDQDLFIAGFTEDDNALPVKIYVNQGSTGNYNLQYTPHPFPEIASPKMAWGDYNGDLKLDLLITGYDIVNTQPISRMYQNMVATPNTLPGAPTGLSSTVASDYNSVVLKWNKASDAETSPDGLSYNVYVSDVSGAGNKQTPMADISNGYRRVVATGNTGSVTSDVFNGLIPGKRYYWSVQSIDAGFAGSAFAPEQSFIVLEPQTITFTNITSVYGDEDFIPAATASSGLTLSYSSDNANVATITADGKISIKGAGISNITASQAGNATFFPAPDVTVTLTVTKKMLTVTAEDKTIVYGAALPELTYIITGMKTGETKPVFTTPVNITTDATATSAVGIYNITATGAVAANYDFTYVPAKLTITKAAGSITFNNLPTKTYGDADFTTGAMIGNGLPISYTSSNTGVATIINGNVHITGAGTTTITAKQAGDNNYLPAPDVSITLTVNKKGLTVTAIDKSKLFGAPNPTFTYTITGFVNGENESVFTTPITITATGVDAGTYPTIPSNATANNYTFNFVAGILTIQKATQTITFPPLLVKTYGDADFNPGATSSVGLPITYTSSDPNIATIINGNIHITGAGTVTITASQAGNGNYNAGVTISQQLMVKKARQTIQFAPMAKRTVGEPAFDPGAIASSGLPVSYVIENTQLATLNGGRITPIRTGFTKITATQPGNNNYEAAEAVTQELEITSSGSGVGAANVVTPNGDGINDYLHIDGISQFPDNKLYISYASGKIVFDAKGYNNRNNVFKGFARTGTTLLSTGVYYYVLFYQGKKHSGYFVLEY